MRPDLKGIPPAYLELFLERAGWRRLQHDYFATQQWVHPRSGIDVLLPKSEELDGYERLALRVVEALASTTRRDPVELIHDLRLAGADVIRIRRPTDDADDTIPLADGRAVLDSALKLVGAAAASSVRPRAVLPSRRPRQALDYVDRRLSLGHSERGSYVVTIVSNVTPLNTPGEPGLIEYLEAPFPRLVTRTLYRALTTSKTLAPEIARGEREAIAPAVQEGISADLLDAMAGILDAAPEQQGLGFDIRWAPVYPEGDSDDTEQLWFEREERYAYSEAARIIKESEPLEAIAVTGVVEGLHREEGEPSGSATVACIIEGSPRKLHTRLEEEDYEEAILAHRDMRVVVFRADVERRGNRFHGTNVHGFRLTDD